MAQPSSEMGSEPTEQNERPCAPSLRVARLLSVTEAGLAARMIETARVVVAACGDEALGVKGFTCVEELTPAQVRRWRAEAKADAVTELQLSTGRGAQECRHLVALACAPAGVRGPVIAALDGGLASWRQVQAFWRRCARLDHEAAAVVAQALFGTDDFLMAKERLDPDGEPTDEPWQQQRYTAALEREATAAEGMDVAAERARRREAYAARRASMTADDDGTGTITIGADLIRVCGAYARLDRAARLLRKSGEERTLDQLRADVAAMLLVHGQLPVPRADSPDEPSVGLATGAAGQGESDTLLDDLWSPAQEERMAQVLAGMPSVAIQVVTPWNTLTSSLACQSCDHVLRTTVPRAGTGPPRTVLRGAVGQILGVPGTPGVFITPGQVRELALAPGTTLHRLLTDPADGRLIERTLTTYRPDADMRRQIIAADVTARVPWSTHPASACELDHVEPWTGEDGGGATSETNLAALPIRPHGQKTARKHAAIINERRDLTWTTLLARSSPTRVHDYRQYLAQVRYQMDADEFPDSLVAEDIDHAARSAYREGAHSIIADDEGLLDITHPDARETLRDLAARALYAALATRGPRATLEDLDDLPGATEHGGETGGWMFVSHRRDGIRRPGPAPDQATPEQLLDTDPSYYGHPPAGPTGVTGATGAPESSSKEQADRPWDAGQDYGPPPF